MGMLYTVRHFFDFTQWKTSFFRKYQHQKWCCEEVLFKKDNGRGNGAPLLFRLRVSENGLFLAISAPSVPFRGSFSQKGRGRDNLIAMQLPGRISNIIKGFFIHFIIARRLILDRQPSWRFWRNTKRALVVNESSFIIKKNNCLNSLKTTLTRKRFITNRLWIFSVFT